MEDILRKVNSPLNGRAKCKSGPFGEQDAKCRFSGRYGNDGVCLQCEDRRIAQLSFEIDGVYRETAREDFVPRTYGYKWKIAANVQVTLRIREDTS